MTDAAIVAEDLRKSFGQVVALDGVGFEVARGSVFGLLGPNGAGKTTAVRILSTVLRADAGRASILGTDVARDARAVRHLIGLAGQFAAIDENLTGRENLSLIGKLTHLGRREIGPRADELLARFGLADAGHRPARTYSGGMRRRLDLAAALVHRPPVLILDEPTTGLDPASRRALWDVIRELVADGTTVLLTTQYLEEADRLAARVAVVDHGRVIALDTPAALKARLGATVIEMGFGDEQSARRAADALAALSSGRPKVQGVTVHVTSDGPAVLMDAVRRLDGAALVPHTLTVREPSLDDVFLALTGHRATKHEAPAREPEEVA